jgi:hypothetical protein
VQALTVATVLSVLIVKTIFCKQSEKHKFRLNDSTFAIYIENPFEFKLSAQLSFQNVEEFGLCL